MALCRLAFAAHQRIKRNRPRKVNRSDHIHRQLPPPVENLRRAAGTSDDGSEIFSLEAILFHMELNRLDRVGRQDRPSRIFISSLQNTQNFEFVVLCATDPSIPDRFDPGQGGFVVSVGVNGMDGRANLLKIRNCRGAYPVVLRMSNPENILGWRPIQPALPRGSVLI